MYVNVMRWLGRQRSGVSTAAVQVCFLVAFGFLVPIAPLQAAIVGTGDLIPAFPWSSSTTAYVGLTAGGTLSVNAGSQLSSNFAYLGYNSSASGVATITGSGSLWTNIGPLYVGDNGSGTLNVASGGQVNSSYSILGSGLGASGVATITDAGSKWTNSGILYVGRSGSGTLTVADGGQVTAGILFASLGDLYGNGSITATQGAVLDADLRFDAAHGLKSIIPFGAGGTLSVTASGRLVGQLGAGYKGHGSLTVSDGVAISISDGYLGYYSGASGVATIIGTGSKWTNSNDLYVGYNGGGTLNVVSGGQVNNAWGYIGYNTGATGVATIIGSGSLWTNISPLYIGDYGSGTLNVASGGQVSSNYGLLGENSGATGMATIAGAGSKWTISGYLSVGDYGSGTLNVASGGQVSNDYVILGNSSGASGVATITGAGSKWTNSREFYVGYGGSGTLSVNDGGQITTASIYASLGDLHGNGMITATQGAVLDADWRFDASHGSKSVFPFGSGGTLTVSLSGGVLGAGYKSQGSLTVADGMTISSGYGELGYMPGALGVATITGSGSKWTNSGSLYVGQYGSGTLNVSDGGQVTAASLYASPGDLYGNGTITSYGAVLDADMRFDASHGSKSVISFGSAGTLTVTASGGDLGAGYKSHGSLTVADGVAISSSDGYLGYYSSASGVATIIGTGSKWTMSNYINVGYFGSGTLNVATGGQVNSNFGVLGQSRGESGVATITGPGSKWTNVNTIYLGYWGSGTLKVASGGQVSSRGGYLGCNQGAIGLATITGSGSKWTNSYNLYVGDSGGSGTFQLSDGGQVTAGSVSVNSQSLVAIDVGNGSALSVGGGTGGITNNGKAQFTAAAGAAAGQYRPIAATAFTGSGAYTAIGGTWDPTGHVFTVSCQMMAASGMPVTLDLASQQRLLVSDSQSGWSVGASLLAKAGSANFTATVMPGGDLGPLTLQFDSDESLLGAWQFSLGGSGYSLGDPVYLSFPVADGTLTSDLHVWHWDGTDWTAFPAGDLNVGQGYANFTVTSFSGYAVSVVPEPSTLALLSMGAIGLLAYRRWQGRAAVRKREPARSQTGEG